MDWLENAINRGFINFPFLNQYDSFLDNIRGEERFKRLMERVKYDWERFEELQTDLEKRRNAMITRVFAILLVLVVASSLTSRKSCSAIARG